MACSLDLWTREQRGVAIAPLFDEDLTAPVVNALCIRLADCTDGWAATRPYVPPNSMLLSPDMSFLLKHSTIRLDWQDGRKGNAPNKDVFLCMVAQSRGEFMYDMKKVSIIVFLGKFEASDGKLGTFDSERGWQKIEGRERKIAKAIRRAIGVGLMPSVHQHPEIIAMELRGKAPRGGFGL